MKKKINQRSLKVRFFKFEPGKVHKLGYSLMISALLWLIWKLIILYSLSILSSVSFYFYLHRTILPPHRTLRFPVEWREDGRSAVIDLGRGQRTGGNFYLKHRNGNKRVISSNVPYDFSLLLKYPDRPEIANLGNLKLSTKLSRRSGQSVGVFETLQALRYESPVLRWCKEVLRVPGAVWKDSGSVREERIKLFEKFVDEDDSEEERINRVNKKDNRVDSIFKKDFIETNSNPIEKIEIFFTSAVPPLHSLQLEILVNLSPLQHFLFYYRIPAAVLIIGMGTAALWFLVTIYALIEFVTRATGLILRDKEEENLMIKLDEDTEFSEIERELDESDNERAREREDNGTVSSVDSVDFSQSISVESINFPPAESVANFIGDLRQRKRNYSEDEDEYEESDEIDQSVP